jgi:hypothetical protein
LRIQPLLSTLVLLSVALVAAPARAAGPTVSDCLNATEMSLKLQDDRKLHDARKALLICVSPSCPASVRAECVQRVAEVNAAMPTIVFAATSGSGQDLSAVKVSMDGQVIAEHLDGVALELDPGSHEFTFEAPELPVTKSTLVIREGEKNRRESVMLGTPPAPPVPTAAESTPPVAPLVPPSRDTSSRGHTRRVTGIVTAAAGVAGLGIGAAFGGLAFAEWSSVNTACPSHTGCPPAAITDRSHGETYGAVSDIGFIAGGVLAAVGVTLYLTAPKDTSSSAALTVAPGAIRFGGSFE